MKKFLIIKGIERDNVRMSSCKVPAFLVRFELNMKFLDIFSKNIQISNYMKIRQMGNELLRADRRTDRQK